MRSTSVNFGGKGINILAGSKIIFIGISAGVNDCCCWLFMGLIFAFINSVSY